MAMSLVKQRELNSLTGGKGKKKIMLFLTKGEESIASQCSSLGLFSCLPEGDSKALSSVWLPTAHSQHAVVLYKDHQVYH